MIIREIQPKDNPVIEKIIRDIFPEFDLPLIGNAYEDSETPQMFESFQAYNEVYYIIEENGVVLGGGGIKPLKGQEDQVCELQKLYLEPITRGKGYGRLLFIKCLEAAQLLGYKKCYLESASQFGKAIGIYEKNGFQHLDKPLGNTGHYSCGVWMIKELS